MRRKRINIEFGKRNSILGHRYRCCANTEWTIEAIPLEYEEGYETDRVRLIIYYIFEDGHAEINDILEGRTEIIADVVNDLFHVIYTLNWSDIETLTEEVEPACTHLYRNDFKFCPLCGVKI